MWLQTNGVFFLFTAYRLHIFPTRAQSFSEMEFDTLYQVLACVSAKSSYDFVEVPSPKQLPFCANPETAR